MNWKDVKKYSELRRFVKELIGLRKRYLSLSIATAFGEDSTEKYPVVSFHGYQPYQPDYSADSSLVCLMLDPCQFAKGDPVLFIAFNNNFEGAEIVLPQSPDGNDWRVVLNTGVSAPHDIFIEKDQPVLENQTSIWIGARSSIVLSAFSSDATR